MTHIDRFLSFAYSRIISEDGFIYSFSDNEIEMLPNDSDFRLTVDYQGTVTAEYTQYQGLEIISSDSTVFDFDTLTVPTVLDWLKPRIK